MSAFEYRYRINGLFKTPAEVAGVVCQQLTMTKGGLTPKTLVNASRPIDAPLHQEFEWNNNKAAEKYREEQAKKIIRNVVIVEVEDKQEEKNNIVSIVDKPVDRGFVSTGENNHQYVSLAVALSNDTWRDNLLEAAKRDMRAFIAKYHRLKELANIIDDINDFLA